MTSLVYLHGFASGPQGTKGGFCRRWAEARGVAFHAPDLNLPTFEALTLTAQVRAVEALLLALPEPPVVVGSSLGGLVAAAALQAAPMARLILLAPGFGFARRRLTAPDWADYRAQGRVELFHYASNRSRVLGPELLGDLPGWVEESAWRLPAGTEILHGRHDDVVPLVESEAVAARNPGVVLHILEDDHALLAPGTLDLLGRTLDAAFSEKADRP